MTEDLTPKRQLPEDRQFRAVVIGCCITAVLFMTFFVAATIVAVASDSGLLTSDWYGAWGTWAGGTATAAAFLIAAFSLRVSSAHAHADRAEAAEIRQNNDMAQARLLVIYKVERPGGISSLVTFNIENRSKDVFFDVSVPFVDSPHGPAGTIERRTPDLIDAENRLHEFVPTAELLPAYQFTLVTVHTSDWQRIKFAVEYTDSGGRRWRQHLGGKIEPVFTTEAVPIRDAGPSQPPQQIRRLSNIDAWRAGAFFSRDLPPLEEPEEFLEVLGVATVARWRRIELDGEPIIKSDGDTPLEVEVTVKFKPAGPPFWDIHLRNKLIEQGFRFTTGSRNGVSQTQVLRCAADLADRATELLREAIAYANDEFEKHELSIARGALEARINRGRRPNV